jgi:hypothetical protein
LSIGCTASQASLVISQSSVSGLSDAWRVLSTERRELKATGANASVIETTATTARERICIVVVEVVKVKVKELNNDLCSRDERKYLMEELFFCVIFFGRGLRQTVIILTIVERTGTGWLKKIQIHMIDGASESDGSKCHYGNQYVELDGE